MRVRLIGVAAAISLAATVSLAADLGPLPVAPPIAAPTIPVPPPVFDWQGPYFGLYGALSGAGGYREIGFEGGFDFEGNFVLGARADLAVQFFPGSARFETEASLRAGYVIGTRILPYVSAGLGMRLPLAFEWTAGIGIEAAMGQRFSVFAEVDNVRQFGVGQVGVELRVGVHVRLR